LATAATLHTPTAVAVDTSGNIYIADANNNVVRKVAANGIITTVAGNGTAGYSGDNGPATSASLNIASLDNMALDANGNLYVAEFFNNRVRKITPGGPIVTIAGNGTKGFSGVHQRKESLLIPANSGDFPRNAIKPSRYSLFGSGLFPSSVQLVLDRRAHKRAGARVAPRLRVLLDLILIFPAETDGNSGAPRCS
jgi:hypothetical protein